MPKIPSLRARQVIGVLLKIGFIQRGSSGGNMIFRHIHTGKIVPVPMHGSRDIKKGTMRNIIRQSGLSVEEFLQML